MNHVCKHGTPNVQRLIFSISWGKGYKQRFSPGCSTFPPPQEIQKQASKVEHKLCSGVDRLEHLHSQRYKAKDPWPIWLELKCESHFGGTIVVRDVLAEIWWHRLCESFSKCKSFVKMCWLESPGSLVVC